jgi:hypothetical protein
MCMPLAASRGLHAFHAPLSRFLVCTFPLFRALSTVSFAMSLLSFCSFDLWPFQLFVLQAGSRVQGGLIENANARRDAALARPSARPPPPSPPPPPGGHSKGIHEFHWGPRTGVLGWTRVYYSPCALNEYSYEALALLI